MKKQDEQWMSEKIMDFMIIINDCITSTSYADDRQAYTRDLARAAIWLVRIYKKDPIVDIGLEIVSEHTGKYFGDYWKKSPWGEKEIEALDKLQNEIKNRFQLDKN